MLTREEKLALYDEAVANCPRFERKGTTMPYTSANGHMFSQLNKDGELGIRFSRTDQEKHIRELGTATINSSGTGMRGYVLATISMA